MSDDRTQRVIWASAAALLALPAVVLGFEAPVWTGLVAAIAMALLVLFVAPGAGRSLRPTPPVLSIVLREAEPAFARLETYAHGLIAPQVGALSRSAGRMLEEVKARPERLPAVQRMLAHYLPKAAELAALHHALDDTPDQAGRRADIAALLDRLAAAFAQAERALDEQDLRLIDTELRLVRESLDEDFAR